jgi:hypothetical protein
VVFILAGLLFVLVGVAGFVGFMHEGDPFGAWFFMLMFVGGSFGFFIGAAAFFGMRIGSLREAWRAVLGGAADEPDEDA